MPILSSRSSLPCAVVEPAHRLAHAQRRGQRTVGRQEGRHHRIADGLDHGAAFGRDDLVQRAEMLAHQVEGDQVADPLVELGRALEVGEQEGEAGDLQPLVDVERVGAVDVAEGLVGQQALGGQERPALAERCRAARRRRSRRPGSTRAVGAVLERQPQRPGPQVDRRRSARARCCRRASGSAARCVGSPLTSMNCAACVTGSNTMTNSAGSCSDRMRLLAGRQLDGVERDLLHRCFEIVLGQVDAASPRRPGGNIPRSAASSGSCAAIRRTRGLTVKVTSTISSSVGS